MISRGAFYFAGQILMGCLMLSGSVYFGRRTPKMRGNKIVQIRRFHGHFVIHPLEKAYTVTCFALQINDSAGSPGLNNP